MDNSIDTFCLQNHFLVANPGYIALGKPSFGNWKFTFKDEMEIRFPVIILPQIMKNLFDVGKELEKAAISPKNISTVVMETEDCKVTAKIEEANQSEVILISEFDAKDSFSFTFNLLEYLLLLKGFKILFFKPFCLTLKTEFILIKFIEVLQDKEQLNLLKNIKTWSDAFELVQNLPINDFEVNLLYLSQLIHRYLKELFLYVKLSNKVLYAEKIIENCK